MAGEEISAVEPEAIEAERAGQALERAAERSGVDFGAEPTPAPDRPARSVQTRTEGTPEPPAAPDYRRAGTAFRERMEAQRQENYRAVLERLAEKALREMPAEPAPAPGRPGRAENPFDRDEDYWNYERFEREQDRLELLAEIDERNRPIREFFERQQQQEAASAQEYQQQEARRRYLEEQSAYAREAHETYAATPEGTNYMDRVLWLVGDPGSAGDPARGVPAREPLDGALVIAWEAAGFPTDTARRLAQAHVHGMQDLVMQHNQRNPHQYINPAAAIDRFTRAQLAAAADYFGLTGAAPAGGGNGNGRPAAAPGPTPAQRRVAGHKAAASSAVAGSVGEGGGEGGQDLRGLLQTLSAQGRLGTQEMRQLSDRFFPNIKGPKDRMQRLIKVLRELEHEAGAAAME